MIPEDRREDPALQGVEGARIPQEARDVDQDVVIEGFHLIGVFLQELDIGLRLLHLLKDHPALDASPDGRVLVFGEIGVKRLAEQMEDLREAVATLGKKILVCDRLLRCEIRMVAETLELAGDPLWREDEIHHAGLHGAPWHPAVLCGLLALSERDPSLGLDRLQPQGAIGRGSREDHADRLVFLILGE